MLSVVNPNMKPIEQLVKTIAKLRSPKGCPWDKEQTHKTLKRYLIEEAYETIDAIDSNDSKALMEELGDVLLQVVLHAQIARENKKFSFSEIADCVNKKMISRHPHVFSNTLVKNSDEVMVNWEKIKKKEKPERKDIFDGIPLSLPALLKALKTSKKAAREGFEWKKEADIWKTLDSEIKEFKSASKNKKADELGDILFTIVNIARWYKLDPEDSLRLATKKFISRYKRVKNKIKSSRTGIKELSYSKLNNLWKLVKKEERGKR